MEKVLSKYEVLEKKRPLHGWSHHFAQKGVCILGFTVLVLFQHDYVYMDISIDDKPVGKLVIEVCFNFHNMQNKKFHGV